MQDIHFRDKRVEREAIHSGQFMVSHFEAEEQDDEDDVAVPVPETEVKNSLENIPEQFNIALTRSNQENGKLSNQQLSIETNLSKLFQCMSLAYRCVCVRLCFRLFTDHCQNTCNVSDKS